MQYVIDASVAVKWFLPEPNSDKADALLDDFLLEGLNLVAPDLLVPEVGNALLKRSVKTREISVRQAEESYRDFLALGVPLEPCSSIAEQALNLAAQEQHAIYDVLYLVLALQRGCELITADQILVNKLGAKFHVVRWLGNL